MRTHSHWTEGREPASRDALMLWNDYADYFHARWGIARDACAMVAGRAKTVCGAEYREHGGEMYRTSVLLPIRNAFYGCSQIDGRWGIFQHLPLVEPILDYGCGVGVLSIWMARHGRKNIFGYEIPGVQQTVMRDMLMRNGLQCWEGQQVKTVVCMNVLEHVADPVSLLKKLLGLGHVIANICKGHDEAHVADHAELDKCERMLTEQGTVYHAA